MREDELALGQCLAKNLRERGDPLLRSAIASVDRVQVLVIDVNTVKTGVEDELRELGRGADGVRGRGLFGLTERGRNDADARVGVLCLLCGTDIRSERGKRTRLVECSTGGEEGESEDVPTLCDKRKIKSCERKANWGELTASSATGGSTSAETKRSV